MRCSYCRKPLRLLDPRRPQCLLLPRCRFCGGYTLSWVHKAAFYLLGVAVIYLLIQAVFSFR